MSAFLNVVLSMLLIYLIFSIVVSRLQEWGSQTTHDRGKHLREGIHRLIADETISTRVLRHPLISGLYRDPKARTAPPSYIEPTNFALALANLLVRLGNPPVVTTGTTNPADAKTMAAARPLTFENLRAALENFGAQRSPIALALLPVIDRANGDLAASIKGIEDWFNAGMDRVSGWYKTKARRMLFLIGFALAILVDIDSIAIFQALNRSPSEAARLAAIAEKVNESGKIGDVDLGPLKTRAPTRAEWKAIVSASSETVAKTGVLPIGYKCLGATASLADIDASTKTDAREGQATTDSKKASAAKTEGAGVLSMWSACRAELSKRLTVMAPSDWLVKILGWILTAFAGSLGASYWFAAISKVINIRSSGPRPEATKAAPGAKA
jgi:hypothetical protein